MKSLYVCCQIQVHKGTQLSARKILKSIYNLQIQHSASPLSDFVTVSAGCLTVEGRHHLKVVDLLEQVDKLLYKAKNAGRN